MVDISGGSEATRRAIYERKAQRIIKNLKRRNIQGVYFGSSEEAVTAICGMIPEGSLVGLGGSESILESGLVAALRKMPVRLLDRYREGIGTDEVYQMRLEGLRSDVYIAGCNAVTADGKLVNEDGIGNRVAAIAFGPAKVILLAGMNKAVANVDEAIARIKTIAAPLDAVRVNVETPCSKTGFCADPHCFPPKRICSHLVVTEGSMMADRITVVLVGEDLGY